MINKTYLKMDVTMFITFKIATGRTEYRY